MNLFKEQGVKDYAAAASCKSRSSISGPYFAGEAGALDLPCPAAAPRLREYRLLLCAEPRRRRRCRRLAAFAAFAPAFTRCRSNKSSPSS